eukprot:1149787-Pelagomonas_calceolata.AAC.2
MEQGEPILVKDFTDLRHRLHGVWRVLEGLDSQTTKYTMAAYQALFALPFDHNVRKPIRFPRHLHLDLPQHVMQNVSRIRLRAHTLNVETASWEDGCTPLCHRCSCGQIQDEIHVLFICTRL